MDILNPLKTIVPIIRWTEEEKIKEILGTGSFIGVGENLHLLTASHNFEPIPEDTSEKFGFVFSSDSGNDVWPIRKIYKGEHIDVAVCHIPFLKGMIPLQFSKQQPSLNADVFCYEYSSTRIEKKSGGGKHVSFEPLSHKGNIMRFYESEYPEVVKTPSFNTSFPALQGASGAPVVATSEKKKFYIAGILVANQETHLMPAQVVEIVDGDDYMEETKYFLPMGKGIQARLLTQFIEGMDIEIEYVE